MLLLQIHQTLHVHLPFVWALVLHTVSSLRLIKWQLCQLISFPLPLPSVLTRHLLILSVLPLYSLGPPQELIPYTVWQAIKDGGHSHTYMGTEDMQLTCRAVTRSATNHFINVRYNQLCTQIFLSSHTLTLRFHGCFSCIHICFLVLVSHLLWRILSLFLLRWHYCCLSDKCEGTLHKAVSWLQTGMGL